MIRAVDDRSLWRQLGLEPGAGRREIKRAYYHLARLNHPDFFPEERKAVQELKMIGLNEAYAHLMGMARLRKGWAAGGPSRRSGSTPASASAAPRAAATAVGPHREPAYAYYKQGFVHFSRAVHGIEALYRTLSRREVMHFEPLDDAYQRFAEGLVELRRAHEYFSRVIQEFDSSIWRHDARVKLGRIERFSALYRRILGNLKRAS